MIGQQLHNRRVLFFDSGIGGLSIYQAVMECNQDLDAYYLFDKAAFPYSNKDEDFVIKRVDDLCELMQERYHFDLIVIACNTASTIALPLLRDRIGIPIVGVVPAIKPAAALSHKKNIALLATEGTVKRQYTKDLIANFAQDCKVQLLGSTRLVELCEDKILKGKLDMDELAKILSPLTKLKDQDRADVIVLGCTHFPLIKDEISQIVGPEIKLIDSGEAIGRRVHHILNSKHDAFNTEILSHHTYDELVIDKKEMCPSLSKLLCSAKVDNDLRAHYSKLQKFGFCSLESIIESTS